MSQKSRRQNRIEKANAAYRAERADVLRSLSVERMIKLFKKYNQPIPKEWGNPLQPKSILVPLAVMHRARLALPDFTYAEKLLSAQWLTDHNYPIPPAFQIKDGILYINGQAGTSNEPQTRH